MAIGVPATSRRWVEEIVGGRVVRVARLRGGITAAVHLVTVETARGARTSVVLRRWVGCAAADRAAEVAREATALELLEATSIPAPRLLGVSDGTGTEGVAALLMTRVRGRVDLSPADPGRWTRELATTLVGIHELDIDRRGLPAHVPAPRPDPGDVPAWAERPAVWRAAFEVLQAPPPQTTRRVVHGDYQHFNLLWTRGRLRGVVDWVEAAVGAPDVDVGHCRLNLAVLYGVERAEAFRLAYEAGAGRALDPWWDIHRLTGYDADWPRFIPVQVAGRVEVDVAGMTRRVEDVLAAALRRL